MLNFKYREMVKYWLKSFISKSGMLHELYNNYALKKQAKYLRKKVFGSGISDQFITREKVIEEIERRKEEKGSDICHIIGSGWSLNHSIDKICHQDFIIGFNYAAIADLDFDVYFFEFGGENVKEISVNHLELARSKVANKTDLVYFKNVWETKNDINYIAAHWLGLARPVLDHLYTVLDKKHLNHVLTRCLNDQTDYIPQLCSSVVTAIILAYQAGFKKVVIHGLDFGGQYFYECMESKVDPIFLPPPKPVSGFYGKSSKSSVHPTALNGVGMRDIIPVLHDLLEREEVSLMCGCLDSPATEYLPVYRNN